MESSRADAIESIIAEGLRRFGADNPRAARRTIILRNGHFAGQRFDCPGVSAVLPPNGEAIEFRGPGGDLMEMVPIGEDSARKAA